jgi:hypothetical protein
MALTILPEILIPQLYYRIAKKTGTVCYYRHFQNSFSLEVFTQHTVPVFLLSDSTYS